MRSYATVFSRRGALPAASAVLGMLVTYFVLQLLSTASWAILASTTPGASQPEFPLLVVSLVWGTLPFAVGVFVGLWVLAPIAAELHVAHVITRALLAAAAGIVVAFLVQFAGALFGSLNSSDAFVFGWFEATLRMVGNNFDYSAGFALFNAVTQGISLIPLTVLAGVLLWVWLQNHPHKHAVSGLIDEV